MPKLKITKTFPFAHRGCDVVEYQAGTEIETDDQDLIDTVLAEKWGHRPRIRKGNQVDGTSGADLPDGDSGEEPEDADDSSASADTTAADPAPDAPAA